ncbi:MAG: thermonuclease family protein [Archangium sp.]|nr:thermonuclease family protein [Archangium sp.]MDP3569179.1 thermonuclease family protein [Archangium sp.]
MKQAALVVMVLSGCSAPAPESTCGPSTAQVDFVIDGDTLALLDGTRVRLLLVDTPETTQGKNDCYGEQAKAFTVSRVAGKTINLAYDEGSCTDRFGRTLAYVTVDGVELNAELAKQGLACFLYVSPGGQARQEEFATYEAEARTDRTGMWGACTDIPCSK